MPTLTPPAIDDNPVTCAILDLSPDPRASVNVELRCRVCRTGWLFILDPIFFAETLPEALLASHFIRAVTTPQCRHLLAWLHRALLLEDEHCTPMQHCPSCSVIR